MRKIEVKVLNPEAVAESEKMMVCAARLTQRGHQIENLTDFLVLYEHGYHDSTVTSMVKLPHPTIQKFGVINVVVVGASRRFLAQITRHQNEVKFMSASLQYSDYSGEADFVVPYSIIAEGPGAVQRYYEVCSEAMTEYAHFVSMGVDNDAAGYMAPQGLRNTIIISATPYQWKHMISQRTCRRNTDETRYIMLRIWEQLYGLNMLLFQNAGPACTNTGCAEGRMQCSRPCNSVIPENILAEDFPLLTMDKAYNAKLQI